MRCKLDHRVGATRAVWLSLPAEFARAWDSASGVSAPLKTPVAASRSDNNELLGRPGNAIGLKSCRPPFVTLDRLTRRPNPTPLVQTEIEASGSQVVLHGLSLEHRAWRAAA